MSSDDTDQPLAPVGPEADDGPPEAVLSHMESLQITMDASTPSEPTQCSSEGENRRSIHSSVIIQCAGGYM